MTSEEATQLARRFKGCWNYGPAFEDWFDILEPLDEPNARETYNRLRQASDHAPSIATFVATYRTLAAYNPTDTDCAQCQGTGHVPGPPIVQNAGTERERRYSTVQPCPCQRRSNAA